MNGRSPLYSKIGWLALGVVVVVASAWLPAPAADAQSQTMQRILYGEVVSAERITIRDRPTGRGAQTGSTVGAGVGCNWLMTVVVSSAHPVTSSASKNKTTE